jgi:hypothetical protein
MYGSLYIVSSIFYMRDAAPAVPRTAEGLRATAERARRREQARSRRDGADTERPARWRRGSKAPPRDPIG